MLSGSSVKIVGEATDAPSTLALAKKHTPRVVLLDAAIPGGDAFVLDARQLYVIEALFLEFTVFCKTPAVSSTA
jgi:DNA-binding NarL/FixJ family response regulator